MVSVRVVKFLLLVGLLVAGVVGFYVLVPYGPSAETFVDVMPGTGTAGIAVELEKAGVIRSRYAFEAVRAGMEIAGKGGTLKAGEYRFDGAASVLSVYDKVRRGDVYTVSLSVPEGYNIFDIAQAVQVAGLGSRDEFLKAEMAHVELIAAWSPQAKSLEGYLFPDTYKFGRHATAVQMLSAMVKRFGQQAQRLGLTGADVARIVTTALAGGEGSALR